MTVFLPRRFVWERAWSNTNANMTQLKNTLTFSIGISTRLDFWIDRPSFSSSLSESQIMCSRRSIMNIFKRSAAFPLRIAVSSSTWMRSSTLTSAILSQPMWPFFTYFVLVLGYKTSHSSEECWRQWRRTATISWRSRATSWLRNQRV